MFTKYNESLSKPNVNRCHVITITNYSNHSSTDDQSLHATSQPHSVEQSNSTTLFLLLKFATNNVCFVTVIVVLDFAFLLFTVSVIILKFSIPKHSFTYL
uniref:SJCHGC02085 protein n=1 Tax=Schistosoma japonicum TaxID=6182 RepID=Q5D9C9_SCHJA|nr:SJCHGC02085 protein [Schistosoma japonicum]